MIRYDIFTTDQRLAEALLSELVLREDQYNIDNSDSNEEVYQFFDIGRVQMQQIRSLLSSYQGSVEIRDVERKGAFVWPIIGSKRRSSSSLLEVLQNMS